MLRLLVIALLLANAGYYAWSQHLLASWGLAPMQQAEPERLAQQIRPEALRIAPTHSATPPAQPAPPAPPPTPSPAPETPANPAPTPAEPPPPVSASPVLTTAPTPAASGVCLQAGPLEESQAEAWRRAARALPQGSWSLQRSTVAARWMVYMGRFADTAALAEKRAELKSRNVAFDKPGGAFEPGLSLGRFSSEEAAERALTNLASKGVRTARVVVERPESSTYLLRLPLVDAALRAQISPLQSALAGKPLRSCF